MTTPDDQIRMLKESLSHERSRRVKAEQELRFLKNKPLVTPGVGCAIAAGVVAWLLSVPVAHWLGWL
jgi:hypothetical protein